MRGVKDFETVRVNTTVFTREYSIPEIELLIADDLAKRAAVLSAVRETKIEYGQSGAEGRITRVTITVDHEAQTRDCVEKL